MIAEEIKEKKSKKCFFKNISSIKIGWGVLIALIVEIIILSVLSPYFLKPENIFNILRSISIIGVVSIGMTMLIISGGLDLSVGAVLGLSGMVTGALMTRMGLPTVLAIFCGLVVGGIIGIANGLLVTKLKINALIVTLGMLSIARGLTYTISKGSNIFVKTSPGIIYLGRGYIGKVPFSVIVMLVLVVFGTLFLNYTVLGRHIYAVGGNERASKLAGVQVNKVRLIVFVITSVLAAFAGLISAGMLSSAEISAGTGLELDVIAAVIIGGASLSGGKGTIIGSLIGAAIMGILKNGFILLGLPHAVQTISIGIVIILAVVIDSIRINRQTIG